MVQEYGNSNTIEANVSSNQMYLVDLRGVVSDADCFDDVVGVTSGIWDWIYDNMDVEDTLWVIAPNDYRNGRMWPIAMAIGDHARAESDLLLKNTITVYNRSDTDADLESSYIEILFFVKDKKSYQFHKDRIRIAHVYEGNEWGEDRTAGKSSYHDTEVKRYNENGKDPGNVWLEEDRAVTADHSVDKTCPLPISEAVRRCVLAGSSDGESIHIIGDFSDYVDVLEELGRDVQSVEIGEISAEGITDG